MEREAIKTELLDILKSKNMMSLQIDVSRINDETSLLNDIALDSIQILEFIVGIENKFKLDFDTDEAGLDCFNRFADLVDFITAKINGGKGQNGGKCNS